jgi:AcrR family transcriptional regulator
MEEKKEKALQAAREHFHAHGYRKASLSELISEVGISKPTFYNYFKNKEELFYAAMLEAYNEFNYRYGTRVKTATNAMEKLETFISTFAWFLDTYPIYKDLFKPGNDLMLKWTQSRYCRDFFSEGVEIVRSILEEGVEEGIFSAESDLDKCSLLLYYLLVSVLSTDPGIFNKPDAPEYRIDVPTLVNLVGYGLLVRTQ